MLQNARTLALLAVLATSPLALHADSYTFSISTTASTFTASGTFSGAVDPFNSNAIDVNSITGSANGYNFLGVVDPNATNSHISAVTDGFTFDNVLYVNPPHTDSLGFLLYLDSPIGTSLAHVFYTGVTPANPGGYEVDVVDPNDPGAITPFSIETFTISPSSVPEPSTLALIGTGLLGLGGLIRSRFRR